LAKRVLFVGDLATTKGIDDLIRAVGQLPDALRGGLRVRVVGDGPVGRREELQDAAQSLGIGECVAFLGRLDAERVRNEYACADVFALPSHGEGMPLSLLEAMAAGLACVVADVGAVPEVVRHGVDALLLPAGDVVALASCLSELIGNGALRTRLGDSAAARVRERFTVGRFHRRLHVTWRDVVAASGPSLAARILREPAAWPA
jgi:glycosyltransferase involved in cell wall biosynthesis